MASAFAGILAAGLAAVRSVAGVPVAYARGGNSATFSATVGKTRFAASPLGESAAHLQRVETWDYIFAASDLDFGSGAVEPRPGDLIDAGAQRYRVVSQYGEPCWRWADPGQTTRRVHTLAVGATP